MTDAIVIGAGPNGLAAAAYLAKAGLDVVVYEKRGEVGGIASTHEFAPGFRASIGPELSGLLLPELIADLDLVRHGLELLPIDPVAFTPGRDGQSLLVWRDPGKTIEEIRKLSPKDAEAYRRFSALVAQFTEFLRPLLSKPAPTPEIRGGEDLLNLIKLGWGFRRLGARPMHELLRVLPMSLEDFLDEWFESDLLKATLAGDGLEGICLGPRSAGTAALFLYRQLGDGGGPLLSRKVARGGSGGVSQALVKAVTSFGGEVELGTGVERILIEEGRVQGVVADGQEKRAAIVVSSLTPERTFHALSDPAEYEPGFMWEVDNIRYRGVTAKLNLALSELPDFECLPGTQTAVHHRALIQVGADLDTLERAYDASKYGEPSKRPFLRCLVPSLADPSLAPEGKHVLSVTAQYFPFRPNGDDEKAALTASIVDTLTEVAPNVKTAILHQSLWTPSDFEKELGLTQGSWHQGEMALDQMFFMRPVPGWARYRTPVDGLYLAGSATHPGGDITGACGSNAAQQALQDRG